MIQFEDQSIDPQTVSFILMATAGMRLLPTETQNQIYTEITNYIKTNYSFSIKTIETISGKMEGIYAWLEVNYLSQKFQKNKSPIGNLSMGGSSLQIAFTTQNPNPNADELIVTVNKINYTVFSKSFSSFGQDAAITKIDTNATSNTCYPYNYPIKANSVGSFNFIQCRALYTLWLKQDNIALQLTSLAGQNFIASSNFYDVYKFFGTLQTPDKATLDKSIQTLCDQSWQQLSKSFPTDTDLGIYCSSGVYMSVLLYDILQLQSQQLTVLSKIDKNSLDWTMGALLYDLLNQANA